MVGTALVAKAPPDGYTLLMSTISGLSISPTLYGGGDFDPMADFVHVSIASRNPSVLVVNPDFAAKTFKDYVEYARANPGKLAYATAGAGSSNHLLGARLEQVIGAALVHVPYRGAGPAMIDTIAGTVPSMFDSLPSAAPHIKAGKVRALAVSGEQRNPAFPDIPTMRELGYRQNIFGIWFAFFAPSGVPVEVTKVLVPAIQAAVEAPAVATRLLPLGVVQDYATPEKVAAEIREEYEAFRAVASRGSFVK